MRVDMMKYPDRPALVENYETKKSFFLGKLTSNHDSFNFSDVGTRLNVVYNGQRLEQMTTSSIHNWDPILDSSIKDEWLHKADRNISEAGKILEKMLEIADAAQDPTLTDEERIQMQLELGFLQHEFDQPNDRTGVTGGNLHLPDTLFTDTDSYKMLQRALDRIHRGEEWDVAEVRNTVLEHSGATGNRDDAWLRTQPVIPFEEVVENEARVNFGDVRALYETEDGWIDYLKQQRPEWNSDDVYFEKPLNESNRLGQFGQMLSDDENPFAKALGYVWETTDDATVPTVGEILKGSGRSVMDSETATVTAEELKKDLAGLEKQREQLKTLAMERAAVQDEPRNSDAYLAVNDKVIKFRGDQLPSFMSSLHRKSFQFSFGKKLNIYGETKEEREAEVAHQTESARQNSLNTTVKFDVPEVHNDGITMPDK